MADMCRDVKDYNDACNSKSRAIYVSLDMEEAITPLCARGPG